MRATERAVRQAGRFILIRFEPPRSAWPAIDPTRGERPGAGALYRKRVARPTKQSEYRYAA
jgi:hypothetical protein